MTRFEEDKKRILDAIKTGERTRLEIELNPEMVEWLLSQNADCQRKVQSSRVKWLTANIEANGWIPETDMKMYNGELVNGQHRLVALKNLYLAYPTRLSREVHLHLDSAGWPSNGLVVNITTEEAGIIDTSQPRTMKQRIKMGYGKEFHDKARAAVVLQLTLQHHIPSNCLLDSQVVEELEKRSWRNFTQYLSPTKQLCKVERSIYIPAPIYLAIKEAYDRMTPEQRVSFMEAFDADKPLAPVTKLRNLVLLGLNALPGEKQQELFPRNATGKSYSNLRKGLYELSVHYLKAFLKGRKNCDSQRANWDD